MKTIFYSLVSFSLLLLSTVLMAQEKPHIPPQQIKCYSGQYSPNEIEIPKGVNSIFTEDFSGTFPPSEWTFAGESTTNWITSETNNAGGSVPEARFYYYPTFTGESKFISPEISTTGMDGVVLEFKQFINHYSGDVTFSIQTSSDGNNWITAWSEEISGDVPAETINVMIDNSDVGSSSFQFAFVFDGNSNNLNYWDIDDVILTESVEYDAGIYLLNVASLAPSNETLDVLASIKNYGTETISFDVNLNIYESSTLVHSSSINISNLSTNEEEILTFSDWVPAPGIYNVVVSTDLTGDENSDNDSMEAETQIIDNIQSKKPYFEEFTSATCIPCAGTNPVIDQVLFNNLGEYSLVKYQVNWPGVGDPYYIEEAGERVDYYNVTSAPTFFGNAEIITPASSMSQEIFDELAEQVSGLQIQIEATIENETDLIANIDLTSFAQYPAGYKLYMAVVEKVTWGNVASNGEEEFHNVMMAMLPNSEGISLDELNINDELSFSESLDISTTFVEQANDLMVVAWVQNDDSHEVIQSEMVDAEGDFETYSVTFIVSDSDGNFVEEALVKFDINGHQETNADGETVYGEVFSGSYTYEVHKAGLYIYSGEVTVENENQTINVVMEVPNYFFYEDFGDGIPNDWTRYTNNNNSNALYWYDGFIIFWRNTSATNDIQLISPMINLSQAGTLFFETFGANMAPSISIGTVDSPDEPETFEEIANFVVPVPNQEFEVDLAALSLTDSYLSFKYDGEVSGYFYLEGVKISISDNALAWPTNLSASVQAMDVVLSWDAPSKANFEYYKIYRDGVFIAETASENYTDSNLDQGFYEYYITAFYDEGESIESNIATANVGGILEYCESSGGGDHYITQVDFADIHNTSDYEGYGDFSYISSQVATGDTYTLSVDVEQVYDGNDLGAWIDYNMDGVFDESEQLFCDMDNGSANYSVEITIPNDAILGNTRMRIKEKYWEMDCDPCGNTTWGETEDYSIEIVDEVGVNTISEQQVRLFPNPAADRLFITSEFPINKILIYHVTGELLQEYDLKDFHIELDTQLLIDGLYFVQINTSQGTIINKLIINK